MPNINVGLGKLAGFLLAFMLQAAHRLLELLDSTNAVNVLVSLRTNIKPVLKHIDLERDCGLAILQTSKQHKGIFMFGL